MRAALDLLVFSSSTNATETSKTALQQPRGTRKTSRVSQSAVRASSSDANGDGQKQPKDSENDAESLNLSAKCARFAFHFYIRVYARASLQLQKDLPNGDEIIEWHKGLIKLATSSPYRSTFEFINVADKYKVDTIAVLTRCNHGMIRETLMKTFTTCFKLTLESDDLSSFERLLQQKKKHDFQSPPGTVTEMECPEAFAAYGMIDTYACFFSNILKPSLCCKKKKKS